jgi:hypothetical protein
LPMDDPRQRRPDISLAKEVLDWHPRVPLQEGLRRTADYFDEVLRLPDWQEAFTMTAVSMGNASILRS